MKTTKFSFLILFIYIFSSIPPIMAQKDKDKSFSIYSDTHKNAPSDLPYAQYFTMEEFKNYDPASDPEAPYNRSSVPLGDRFLTEQTIVNSHARMDGAGVSPLPVFSGGSVPAQGILNKMGLYAYSNWQYTDVMVYWGGGPGVAGINVVIPAAAAVDAAHRNGVPIMSNVFFAPTAYGGQINWVWNFVEKDGDSYIIADKMIETAEYFGFDGWFINQETAGGNAALANEIIELMKYIKANSDLEVYWYDAMTETGAIYWQEQLNANNDRFFQDGSTRVSDYMFLDFGWTSTKLANSNSYARNLGRDPYELYAGIDIAVNGYNTYVNWNGVFPEGQEHVTSLGMYRPDDFLWWQAAAIDENLARESRFWSGPNGDPSNTTTTQAWKGIAHYIPANSVINDMPFFTNFNFGAGDKYFIEGEMICPDKWLEQGWNNLSLQEILPTWKWIVDSQGEKLTPEFDFTEAYYGGNCLKISGNLSSDNHIKLYKTRLDITSNTRLDITLKKPEAGETSMQAGLLFEEDPGVYQFINAGSVSTNDWEVKTLDLSPYAGKTLASISLKFLSNGNADYEIKIGRIGVYNIPAETPAPPANLFIEKKTQEENYITLRLRWDHSPDDIHCYNIYKKNNDGSRVFLGATPNNAYFVPYIGNEIEDSLVTIELEAVGKNFRSSDPVSTIFEWFSPPAQSSAPTPENNAVNISRNISLSWLSGSGATSHDVYFGQVNPPPFAGNQAEAAFNPGLMDANTIYYWQITERNKYFTTAGEIWQFTTGETFVDTSGYALNFDGTDDLLNCGAGSSLNLTGSEITLEAWINPSQFKEQVWQGVVISKDYSGGAGADYGYSLRCGGNGQINIVLGNGAWYELTSDENVVELNKWQHIAATYDGQKMVLYVNGEEVKSQTAAGINIRGNSNALMIGESTGFPGRVFNGRIDEVRIWNKAGTGEQINALMNKQLDEVYYVTPDSGLAGYWQLDEGAGQTAADLTTHGNHGTLGSSPQPDQKDPEWIEARFLIVSLEYEFSGQDEIPTRFAMRQNYPNPFNPETTISYSLPVDAEVQIEIYNTLGEQVFKETQNSQPPGNYNIKFNARNLSSGVYFCKISVDGIDGKSYSGIKKMMLLK